MEDECGIPARMETGGRWKEEVEGGGFVCPKSIVTPN